jgi:YD repeat-containing protein
VRFLGFACDGRGLDSLGRETRQDNPDGTATTTTYDGAGRITGVRHQDAVSTTLDLALLTNDDADNSLTKSTLDGVHSMTYDAASQLLSEYHPIAGVKTWTFDPVGNRLSQDFTQVGVRRLTIWAHDVTSRNDGHGLFQRRPDG